MFLGMEFDTRKTIIALGASAGVLGLLVALDLAFDVMNWYGFLIGVGFIVAIMFAGKLSIFRGVDKQFPYEMIYLVLPLSIVGARAYFVIFNGVPLFWTAFEIWRGGLAIYGGVIGGAIGGIIYCLIKKQSILATADIVAPVLILAQAIGRWGNFVNQEVYGFLVTDPVWQWFPFAVPIEGFGGAVSWHLATFFYESFFDFVGFFLLVLILRRTRKNWGVTGCAYLVYYGIVRYFLEGLRMSEYILFIPGTNFPVSQLVSLIIVAVGIAGIAVLFTLNKHKRDKLVRAKSKTTKIEEKLAPGAKVADARKSSKEAKDNSSAKDVNSQNKSYKQAAKILYNQTSFLGGENELSGKTFDEENTDKKKNDEKKNDEKKNITKGITKTGKKSATKGNKKLK